MKKICLALLLIPIAACDDGPSDPGPGGVSNADAKALDEAAAKLDRVDEESYREEIDPLKVTDLPLAEDTEK